MGQGSTFLGCAEVWRQEPPAVPQPQRQSGRVWVYTLPQLCSWARSLARIWYRVIAHIEHTVRAPSPAAAPMVRACSTVIVRL